MPFLFAGKTLALTFIDIGLALAFALIFLGNGFYLVGFGLFVFGGTFGFGFTFRNRLLVCIWATLLSALRFLAPIFTTF